MPARIFIAYNFTEDRERAHNIRQLFQPEGRCDGVPVFVPKVVPADPARRDAAIDEAIRRVMQGCRAVLFVIGDGVHNSPWINREAKLAVSRALPMVAIRVPGTTGGLPNELRSLGRPIPIVGWSSAALAAELNRRLQKT